VCGLRVTPLDVKHGRVRTWGLRFDEGGVPKFAYFSDVKSLSPAVVEAVRGIPVLVLDALRFETHPTHMCVEESLAAAQEVGAGQTWFTHVTHFLSHAKVEPTLPAGIKLAYDTLVLDL
jgi:phosphoribosyl 1,2-cyclic phosphate phosphodiesterase